MNGSVGIQNLTEVINEIRTTSFEEKKDFKTEEQILDAFLDSINVFKKDLAKKSKEIQRISEKIEGLTWFIKPDQESLKLLNELVILCKDVRSTLVQKYVSYNHFRKVGLAKKEIGEFKLVIDFFKESYSDLELTFFILPNNKQFQEITGRLSS